MPQRTSYVSITPNLAFEAIVKAIAVLDPPYGGR
jgi:hypothetical protein